MAFSTQYVLEWDSVADERLTGYTVYYGEAHRDYDKSVDVGMSGVYIFSISILVLFTISLLKLITVAWANRIFHRK